MTEPSAALYGLCPNLHPRAVRTTATETGTHMDLYCPTCERDGTVGVLVFDSGVEPIDLTAPPRHILELEGSSDPDSLDYGGLLNLLPFGRHGETSQPCSLHPGRVIGPEGCPRCREIHRHRTGRLHAPDADGHQQAGDGDG